MVRLTTGVPPLDPPLVDDANAKESDPDREKEDNEDDENKKGKDKKDEKNKKDKKGKNKDNEEEGGLCIFH